MSKRLHVDVASSEAGETTPPIKSPRSSSPRRASFLSDSPLNFSDDDQQNPSEDDSGPKSGSSIFKLLGAEETGSPFTQASSHSIADSFCEASLADLSFDFGSRMSLEHSQADRDVFKDSLKAAMDSDVKQTVSSILEHETLVEEILKQLREHVSSSFNKSLKHSLLTSNKADRNYLLRISPLNLCREFQAENPLAFNMVTQVLLGLQIPHDDIFSSNFLLNNICLMYSSIARIHNRKATGYALLMGVMARDGGLKEDFLKIFPEFCHPRTLQKLDHKLALNSKAPLIEKIEKERNYLKDLVAVKDRLEALAIVDGTKEEVDAAKRDLQLIQDGAPRMLSTAWDNLNLRGNRRHERVGDTWDDLNFDYMTSIHIEERVDANHMGNSGKAFKEIQDLTIEDFTPDNDEMELLFCSLVPMYSHTLLQRHPTLFKSLRSSIKDYEDHQFSEEMSKKSEEFTGKIYQKSEVKTEELVSMLTEYQDEMVIKLKTENGTTHSHYRRQLTGDQKTEKNSHYAILSKSDEVTPEDRLSFIIPGHEYFHFLMVLADVESSLFRDNSRGLEGGAFSTATLLNRKKAKLSKGKDDIDAIKDYISIKGDARFAQYFLAKYNLDPSKDHTPDLLKTGSENAKKEYLHQKVRGALKDLLPMFRDCTGVMPDMKDFPVRAKQKVLPNTLVRQTLEAAKEVSNEDITSTVSQLVVPKVLNLADHMETGQRPVSSNRLCTYYKCTLCGFESRLESVIKAHIPGCWKKISNEEEKENYHISGETESVGDESSNENNAEAAEQESDFFWNYKCSEFYIDSIFKLCLNFERYGHGAGMYIISKLMLPILHSLGHSNYSNSIHRFVCRVLTSTTPREALLLVSERFSNRTGKIGGNIFKDRRVEFRIKILKQLLRNLGPNVNTSSIQKVNEIIDIKEKLHYHSRKVHGVTKRTGAHKQRSDERDYNLLLENLYQNKAHQIISKRGFGNLKYPDNFLDSDVFDKALFFRWITQKNREAEGTFQCAQTNLGFPGAWSS